MGGRGSGGGRSGGGGGASSQQDHEVRLRSLNDIYQEKYSQMTDSELNRALTNAKNQMNKEQAKVLHEQQKLQKMVDEFKKMKDTDPGVDEKWNAIDKQTGVLNDARSRLDISSQAYYLGINEKHNVRGKYTANDIKNMSNGQLNSFYNNSYKESSKARRRIENTSNPKTRAKYQKIYDTQNDYFNKATVEKNIRGLDGKGW